MLVAESAKILQKMLDVVHDFSRRYRFRFNKDKSNVMIFGKGGGNKFRLGQEELKVVNSYKYLGLILDHQFSFKAYLEKVVEKARKRMCIGSEGNFC